MRLPFHFFQTIYEEIQFFLLQRQRNIYCEWAIVKSFNKGFFWFIYDSFKDSDKQQNDYSYWTFDISCAIVLKAGYLRCNNNPILSWWCRCLLFRILNCFVEMKLKRIYRKLSSFAFSARSIFFSLVLAILFSHINILFRERLICYSIISNSKNIPEISFNLKLSVKWIFSKKNN